MTNNSSSFCFHLPHLPYTRPIPVQHADGSITMPDVNTNSASTPICYSSTELTASHLKKVQDICNVYANCNHQVCKDAFHAVMCPTVDHYRETCMYEWAQKGLNTPQEQEFIQTGEQFLPPHHTPLTAQECRRTDQQQQ